MAVRRRGLAAVALAVAASLLMAACGGDDDSGSAAPTSAGPVSGKFEFFSWWTGPGDSEGKQALLDLFKKQNPNITIVDAVVAGGSGTNAQAVLATRLQTSDPPDSYQRHAGAELLADIQAGVVKDLTSLYDQQGWRDVFPKSLLDMITVDGKIYSVPVNIHRSNVLWYNPKVLEKAGISGPPKTWSEFLEQAPKLKAAGVTPLTIGPLWTQEHLLENVLLGELGPDKYAGLWNGSTDWESTEVKAALDMYTNVLKQSNLKQAAADWQPALDPIIEGDAAYNVMGDWANTYFLTAKKQAWETDYNATTAPGTEGVFNFLSDSFTDPVGAKNEAATMAWLKLAGSKEGQDVFNPIKGSVPARIDGDPSKYTGYSAIPFKDWADTKSGSVKTVGSLTHGVVANNAWKADIETALGDFVSSGDSAKFASAVKTAYEQDK
jgi:glucose/mannose transport system substrate-binding protein